MAFKYGEQICSFGQNERLQADSGRNAGPLFEELPSVTRWLCGWGAGDGRVPSWAWSISLFLERLVKKVTEGT